MKPSSTFMLLLVVLALMPRAQAYYQFGYNGQDGRNGYSGQNGQAGQSPTLFASRGQQFLDLRGGNGTPGMDGDYGYPAHSCYQTLEHNNMIGARGGDGGDGGQGGIGGAGGDATIYFSNVEQLKNIGVDARGGAGATGGRGAYGAQGCICNYRMWTHTYTETRYRDEQYQECSVRRVCERDQQGQETCRDQRFCETRTRRVPFTYTWQQTYYCQDGQPGRYGVNGQRGHDGSLGEVTLINSDAPLGPVTPRKTVSLANMVGLHSLSNHRWSTREGALALLASGSLVQNDYRYWEGKQEHQVQIAWAVRGRGPGEFGDENLQMELTSSGPRFNFPEDFLHIKTQESRGSSTVVTIQQALHSADVKRMRVQKVTGTMKDTYIEVVDDANVSDIVNTRFHIKARWRKASDRSMMNEYLPADLVSKNGNVFRLNIGKLDLKARRFLFFKRKEYFKPGATVKLNLTIERSFGGRTLNVPTIPVIERNLH